MKKLILLFSILTFSIASVPAQTSDSDTLSNDTTAESKSGGLGRKINKVFGWGKEKDEQIEKLSQQVKAQRTLIDSMNVALSNPRIVIKQVPVVTKESPKTSKADEKFISNLPKTYVNSSNKELKKIAAQIDEKIMNLIRQRDSLILAGSSSDLIDEKNGVIQSLEREKNVIKLSSESNELKETNSDLSHQNDDLKDRESKLTTYLYSALTFIFVLILLTAIILQRKRISVQDKEIDKQLVDINKKNNYLEHAARIIRHDMHSGINTYIPRGLSSLEKRITTDQMKDLKIDGSIKMIKEGLSHTQKVYKSVYEFTNLVKQNVVLELESVKLKKILEDYISSTAYSKQVEIGELGILKVNSSLFCTAVDNLIRNGLNFNDSETKKVKVYLEDQILVVEDNGKGMDPKAFEKIKRNKETGGLGLSIALAIIEEHGFEMTCERIPSGTKMKIKINNTKQND